MKTLRALSTSVLLLSSILGACAVAPDDGADDRVEEVVDQTSSALANTGGGGAGLTGSQCTSCGCTLEQTSGPDGNGCRTYRCVCDSTAKAKCVTGKMLSVSAARLAP